jgi:predicted small lipoprotein YifL
MKTFHLFAVVLLVGLLAGCGGEKRPEKVPPAAPPVKAEANPETTPVEPAATEPAEQPEPKLDDIKVNVQEKRIEIQGRFCLEEGILDYLAVTSGGQEYESVVSLRCKGSLLHAGLLAIGALPGPTEQVLKELKQNPPKDQKMPEHPGTPLHIMCEWEKDGKTVSAPACQLLFNRKLKKGQVTGSWCFTGSFFAKDLDGKTEFYMADIEKTLIGVFYAPSAVINLEEDVGNPYDADDTGYAVNRELVPRKDTPVKLIITLAQPPAKE